ncbi:hypothetical protein JCM10908_006306 [Rhodotorula pacifica]|uniref:uncharacterized protein n=1 Tax=Rhodotorula pacifica TaxID=1495444 RepID=UPI00317B5BBF
MAELVISDSEPECDTLEINTHPWSRPGSQPSPASRRLSPRHVSTGPAPAAATDEDVMVLSSASEGEEAESHQSRFFAQSKRKRATSPPPIEWASMGLKGISPRDGLRASGSPADAAPAPSTSVRPTKERALSKESATSSSSFVSALELLRKSGSPPGSDSSDLEPLPPVKAIGAKTRPPPTTAKIPTVKKITARSLASSTSASKAKARARSTDSAGPSTTRPAKRRSISPIATSSGGEEASLPAPDRWAERFSRGSSSSASNSSLCRTQSVEDVKPASSSTTGRAKPWDALEAKIAKVKKPTKRPLRQASLGAKYSSSSASRYKEEEDSDSDVIVTSKPTRDASAKPSSSKLRIQPTLDFLPPPVDLPPDDRIRVLTSCALCSVAWAASKTLAAKQSHLRSCATKLDYTTETVAYLIDKRVLELAETAEQERRALDDGKTLFDRAVGKGEGSHAMKDVTVVGVEGLESGSGPEWYKATREVQAEIDLARKKAQVAKVIKVAKQIRQERQAAAAVKAKEEEAHNSDVDDQLVMPPSTGRLQPLAATLVAERVDAVLGLAASPTHEDPSSFLETPPATQQFEQSRLAEAYEDFRVASPPALPPTTPSPPPPPQDASSSHCETKSKRSRSPFRQLSLPDPRSGSIPRQGHPLEREQQRRKCSLWQLAAGRDDAKLDKVVAAESPFSPTNRVADDDDDDEDVVFVGGGDESSEEAALAQVVKRSSPKRPRRRSKSLSTSNSVSSLASLSPVKSRRKVTAPAASPAVANPPGMPDYDSLAIATLQRKVRQYGFRASKEKEVLVAQLRQVWIAMHPPDQVEVDEEVPPKAQKKGGGVGRRRRSSSTGSHLSLDEDGTPKDAAKSVRATKAKATRKKQEELANEDADKDDSAALDANAVPGSTVGEKLRHLIMGNEKLYLRILRYEPIHIDEFAALATENGVKIARPLLTRFLDEQSITHYSQDPTGGTRRRYR